MKILSGLFSHMVLQRNAKGVCAQAIELECTKKMTGVLQADVSKGGKALKGFQELAIGKIKNGAGKGVLEGLPAGGPYEITLTALSACGKIEERLAAKDVLVGDLWLLGGQSNMQGIGNTKHAPKADAEVRAFYMDERWAVAKDPIHNLWQAKATVHGAASMAPMHPSKGVGPGIGFGQEMKRVHKIPQGLIASAHGGTSMTQWDPKLKSKGDGSLYGAMFNRFKKNGSKVKGLIWYQGCSDTNPEATPLYTQRMIELAKAVRRDFGANLPIVIVQIGRVISDNCDVRLWNSIREQERLLPEKISNLLTVPAIDLALDDTIHINGKDQYVLGKRLAEAMDFLLCERKTKLPPPIELKEVKIVKDPKEVSLQLEVSFANVVGSLCSGSRPSGFTLSDGERELKNIFKTELKGDKVIVYPCISPAGQSLYYGFGLDPYCNITDEAGRSLPAFGPLQIGNKYPSTGFVSKLLATPPLALNGDIKDVPYPKNFDALKPKPAVAESFYCFPVEKDQRGPEPKTEMHYFRLRYKCPENMKLSLLFGYDGPVKLFADGKQVFCDPKGTNPIIIDEASAKISGTKGEHEIIFALSTNKGAAWGICARLARTDKKPREGVVLPEFLA